MKRSSLPCLLGPLFTLVLAAVTPAPAAETIPGYVVLPLSSVVHANQDTVRVSVNGRPTMLILDTGATATMIDEALYKRANVKSSNASPGELPPGVGTKFKANGEPATIGYIDSMVAGGVELGKRRVGVMDLQESFGRYNNVHAVGAIGGLLGEDVLRQYSALIDWRRRGVYLNLDKSKRMHPGASLVANGWTAIPMSLTDGNHYTVPVTVGGKPAKLMVDTGAQFTVFQPNIVPTPQMLYNRDTGSSMAHLDSNALTMSMIGMDSRAYPARVENWQVGDYKIASSVVTVNKMVPGLLSEKSAGDAPMLGLLGAEFLAKNNAMIDLGDAKLYLKP